MTIHPDIAAAHPLRIRRKNFLTPLGGAVLVARPGRWGNPYRIRKRGAHWSVTRVWRDGEMSHGLHDNQHDAASHAVHLYRLWLDLTPDGRFVRDAAKAKLRGLRLACYCKLDAPCHADVLCEIAN